MIGRYGPPIYLLSSLPPIYPSPIRFVPNLHVCLYAGLFPPPSPVFVFTDFFLCCELLVEAIQPWETRKPQRKVFLCGFSFLSLSFCLPLSFFHDLLSG